MNKSHAIIATVGALIFVFVAVLVLGVAHEHPSNEHDHGSTEHAHAQTDDHDHDHGASADHDHAAEASTQGAQTYICPMHPQVRSDDPSDRCPICGMELVPASTSARDEDTVGIDFSGRALALLNLQTTPVAKKAAQRSLRLVGQMEFDENALTSISAWTGGRIERLYVSYTGAEVNQGDALVQLYSPELRVAQQELIQAHRQSQGDGPAFLQASNQTTLRAARERLRLLGLSGEQIDAVIDSGEASDRVTIYAPSSGVVTERAVSQGDYVNTGDTLLALADAERMWAVFEVYERDLSALRVGHSMDFSLRHDADTALTGEIVSIAPSIDRDSRTRQVRVAIDNPSSQLVAGMFIQARAQIEQDEQLVIPASAPLLTGARAVVYVQVEEGYFEPRDVELGARLGDLYAVRSGLEEGDLVVSRGAFRIDSELQLRGRPSMMAPEGNGAAGHDHGHGGHNGADDHDGGSDHHGHDAHQGHNGHSEHNGEHDHGAQDAGIETLAADYDVQLGSVFELYDHLWYALKEDDLTAWQEAAPNFYDAVSAVDWPAAMADIEAQLNRGAGHAHHVSDIEQARDHFYYQSKALIALAQAGYHDGTVFLMFCPMARDDAGAYWLQTDDQLLNPYFGSRMLRCGSVRGELSADSHDHDHDHDHGGHH